MGLGLPGEQLFFGPFSFPLADMSCKSFETPEICNEIIEKFHGKPIGDQGTPLQIRFADTKDQKDLKARTHERRQFKTNEYNTVVFGGASPYPYLSPTSTSFSSPLQNRVANPSAMWAGQSPISPTYVSN